MIEPYFQQDSVTIYKADCREVLPQIGIDSVDHLITDPPYGMNYLSNHYQNGNPFDKIAQDDRYPTELISTFRIMARKSVCCFCRWDNLRIVDKPNSFIAMIKNNWTAGDLQHDMGRQWEGILFYAGRNHQFNKRIPDVIDCRRVPPDSLVHPTQKPKYVIDVLLEALGKSEDIVLDPFMGSGTTLLSALEHKMTTIGIEIEQQYCDLAIKRIQDQLSHVRLF